jgi:hypothetical protein
VNRGKSSDHPNACPPDKGCPWCDVLTTAAVIANDPSAETDQVFVEELVARGYDALRAEVLVAFVPLGLARPVIARLGFAPPIDMPTLTLLWDQARQHVLTLKLADVPEFLAAQQLGEETFETGIIPREEFSAACGFSVELNVINEALNEGMSMESLGGAKMQPPLLLRLAQAPGFGEWYEAVKPGVWDRFRWWLHGSVNLSEVAARLKDLNQP